MSSRRRMSSEDYYSGRDRRKYYNDTYVKGYESLPIEDRYSTRRSARRYEVGRSPHMDPQQQHRPERQTYARGIGALDHFVNGPDHRAEEPLEGSKQQAKLSYSLAGPFNRKVCPFDSPSVDGMNTIGGTSSNHHSVPPRILSPEASPRGADSISSTDSATCHRLKQKFMKMTPSASVTPGDQTGLMNGFSGSTSLAQLQQRMRGTPNYEKENNYNYRSSKTAGNRPHIKPSYPAGPIDEKAGLCPAGISRKVVEGPSCPQYKGFSRGPGGNPSRSAASAVVNGPLAHRSESYGNLFSNRRHDSQSSLNTVQSQPTMSKKPVKKDNISTRSWRKGQELILRELGPNKATSTPNVKTKDEDMNATNVNNSNGELQSMDEGPQAAEVTPQRKRKAVPKPNLRQSQELTPSKQRVRHYKVSEIRAYLRKQQDQRKRKRQEEEAANQARVERVRRQIEELRSQQQDAMKKHVALPLPPAPRTLNKTFVITEGRGDESVEASDVEEMEQDRGEPITIQDLETPCKEAPMSPTYQPPREKYHEVWPPRANGEVSAPPAVVHSPRSGSGSLEPPVAVASRLTALEESANLLQSRIWQLAHRVGNSPTVEDPQRERLAFLSQSVPYRPEDSMEDDESHEIPPPFLSRYDRLTWEPNTAKHPLEEEPYLPGNTVVPEYPTKSYQFASAAFLDDSTSDASEDFILHASPRQESVPPLQRQASRRRSSHPVFRPYASAGEQRRKKIQFKDTTPPKRTAPRLEHPSDLRDDPFSFMRTYRRQRHLHRARIHDSDSTEQNYETTSHSEEEMYSDDFDLTKEATEKEATEKADEDEEVEEEYEDDFTSVAAPQTSSQRSVTFSQSQTAAPLTGRSNANSEDVLESEIPSKRSSYDESVSSRRLQSEGRDEVGELPRPRQRTRLPPPPTTAPEPDLPLRLSPSSLERRLFAELHYLESVEESVRQVGDIERVRAVSMSQQETVSLAQILKARQLAHGQEMRETQLKARQEQLEVANQLRDSRQQFMTTQSIDQVRQENAHAHESTRRIIESHQRATEAAIQAAQQLAQTKFTMSANFGRPATDVGQQVSLSRSTPLPVRSHSPPTQSSSRRVSSPSKRPTTDVDEPSSWSKERVSPADTDDDESTIQTDTPKFDDEGAHDSTDEDVLDHSFRMVLPSEEHRRHGRRTKDVAATNGHHVENNAEESNTPSFRRFTDDMVRQYMREEELRAQHQITLLKLRKNALGEKMHTELEFLETQKRQLVKQHGKARQPGPQNQVVEKQMALIRRWKQEDAEIDQLLEAQELADRRRQMMLVQDGQINKMKSEAKKIRTDKMKGEERTKRIDKRSLADWEQKLHARRQRAEELIRWQEKLKSEEQAVKKLENEALKIWKKSPPQTEHSSETSASQRAATTVNSSSSGSKSSSSAPSTQKRSSPSTTASSASKSDDSVLPRLQIGNATDSTATIGEEVSTDETSTISQESVVLSTRLVRRSEDESSIQEELDKGNVHQDSSIDSITEDVAAPSPTPSASIRTETIAGGTTMTETVKTDMPTTARTRSPPSASYGIDTFESTSNTTSRLKRRLGDSVVSSLTSPRGPPRQMEAKTGSSHPPGRGAVSEDEDSFSCATTTISEGTEASDMEGRLHALKEDLKHRVRTLNRLKREKARVNRERLKQKEELLHKHIEMYDKYITDLKAELDQDVRDTSALDSSMGTPMKPQIKAPKATTRDRSRNNSTDDRRLVSESLESLRMPEKSKNEEIEEDIYSTNFTSAASELRSEKFDDDESSLSRSERSQKRSESSSISEALTKSVGSATVSKSKAESPDEDSDRTRTVSKAKTDSYDDDFYSDRSKTVSKAKQDSPDEDSYSQSFTSAPKSEIGTEISEYLPSKADTTTASSPRRPVVEEKSSSSRSSDKSSVKDVVESVESLSDLFPSSVDTKHESEAVKAAEEEAGEATPRTPRRLTFSEINEEYSPSEDTKSKDSAESEVVKPLPSLDLRPLSPVSLEPAREKTPEMPILPPGDEKQEAQPLSARTIHSQMSDIPEDLPSDEYSYTDEFSGASSSRPASRSHLSEATKSSSSSTSTVTPSAAATSVPEENIEEADSETWSAERKLSDVAPVERKLSDPASEGKDITSSGSVERQLSDAPSIERQLSDAPSLERKLSDAGSDGKDVSNSISMEQKLSDVVSEKIDISDDIKDESSLRKLPEPDSVSEELRSEITASEDLKPIVVEKEIPPKPKVSEAKVAAIVAEIFQETLRDTLSIGLASSRREKQPEKESEVLIEAADSKPIERELPAPERESEEKTSPRWREGSPTLVRSKSCELIAEDVLAEEVDRALKERRMKRRLSSELEIVSPPASPTISVNYVVSDQDSSLSEPLFNDSVVTSTPAAPLISSSEHREKSPEPIAPSFDPEPIPDETPASEASDNRATSPPVSLRDSPRIEEERTHFLVPHARRYLREMVAQAVSDLWPFVCGPKAPRLGNLPLQPSFDFCLVGETEEPFGSLPEDMVIRNRRGYKHMVYSLILDTVRKIYAEEVPLQPWMCSRPTRYRLWRDTKPPSTLNKLLSIVEEEIETHMGFSASRKRESKLTQWSRKKRAGLGVSTAISVDPVDDLLKSELRTEEADWVNYESEEFQVKLQVAEGLLMDLIDDTVQAVQQVQKSSALEATSLSSIPGLLSREIQSGWLDDSNPSLLL